MEKNDLETVYFVALGNLYDFVKSNIEKVTEDYIREFETKYMPATYLFNDTLTQEDFLDAQRQSVKSNITISAIHDYRNSLLIRLKPKIEEYIKWSLERLANIKEK